MQYERLPLEIAIRKGVFSSCNCANYSEVAELKLIYLRNEAGARRSPFIIESAIDGFSHT